MARREAWLAALGVTDWRQRRPLPAAAKAVLAAAPAANEAAAEAGSITALAQPAPTTSAPVPASVTPVAAPAGDTWQSLAAEVAACTRCGLHAGRHCTVFGVGDPQARWLVVGEAPGAEEDRQGEPFVGPAGKLLDAMLRAVGLAREQVYIANILKCRTPDNRDPTPAEVAQCMPFLERQIALLQPAILLAVGSVAARNLLATDVPVERLRGKVHAFGAARTPLVVTYHPACLLRSPAEKRRAWEDLKLARRVAGAAVA